MDKALAGLIGAVALATNAAGAVTQAPCSAASALQATSYADLLKPIPDALSLVQGEGSRATDASADPIQRVDDHHLYHRRVHHRRVSHHHHHHNHNI